MVKLLLDAGADVNASNMQVSAVTTFACGLNTHTLADMFTSD